MARTGVGIALTQVKPSKHGRRNISEDKGNSSAQGILLLYRGERGNETMNGI
jgi:hypothetical protein